MGDKFRIAADLQPAQEALQVVNGIAATIESKLYVESILKATYGHMEQAFGTSMDAMARSNPQKYHHVYEWGMLGTRPGRLFRLKMEGRGRDRIVNYTFRPSVRNVPVPADIPTNRNHKFAAKAWVMELNLPVTIAPKNAKGLIIPYPQGQVDARGRRFAFSKTPVRVNNPGGPGTTGAFAAAFDVFFTTQAASIFESKVRPRLEKDIRQVSTKGLRYANQKVRKGNFAKKSFSLRPATNTKRNIEAELQARAARQAAQADEEIDDA